MDQDDPYEFVWRLDICGVEAKVLKEFFRYREELALRLPIHGCSLASCGGANAMPLPQRDVTNVYRGEGAKSVSFCVPHA